MSTLGLRLYRKMFLVRKAEEKLCQLYPSNDIKTPLHLAIGAEAIEAGVCTVLERSDRVFGTYRNHGLYLALTEETDQFFGELYGKVTGMFRGRGGSMHISSPERGFLGTSAVVGTTIPLALGCAFSQRASRRKSLAVSFFGDGALDEGVFWESINFASLQNLPVLFVCEDNGLAIHSRAESRHAYKEITEVVAEFGLNVFKSESTDVEEIYFLSQEAIKSCRKTKKPSFLHLKYYRYLEHVGINKDFQFGYRSEAEFKKWLKIDPLDLERRKLTAQGVSEGVLRVLEGRVIRQIEKSVDRAQKSPFPEADDLYAHLYYEKK